MKLSGYIIEKYDAMDGAYTCHRLVEEAALLDIDLKIVGIHDCCVTGQGVFNGGCATGLEVFNDGRLLEHRDFVINRYKWGKMKDVVNALADRSYNDIAAYDVYINKYEQVRSLRSEAFRIPEYVLSTSSFPYEALAARLKTPFVVKGLESSMGREVMLIRNEGDWSALRRDYPPDKEWLSEEFIAGSYGKDLRLFCIRGRAVACMKRQSVMDFRANVALGAGVEPVAVDATLKKIAADIYAQTQLDFVGIDLLFGEDGYYLCEINVMPGLEGIEHASGVNVAKEILTMVRQDFE